MPVISAYSDGVPVVAYCLMSMDGHIYAERNANLRFYSASTIKLPVLIAVLRAVDAGMLSLDQELIWRNSFSSGISGAAEFSLEPDEIDQGMPPTGQPVALRQVLRRMITISSNEATNMAVKLVGFDAVNAVLAHLGAVSSTMERLIGDLAALAAGRTHEVTAGDLARIMHAVVSGRAAGPASTSLMLEFLQAQEFGLIGPALSGVHWGSKSGWVTGIQHDVAFIVPDGCLVAAPLAEGCVLAVCTRGYEPDAATEIIQSAAQLAWEIRRSG